MEVVSQEKYDELQYQVTSANRQVHRLQGEVHVLKDVVKELIAGLLPPRGDS